MSIITRPSFANASTESLRSACNEYHLPQHVAPHVEIVTPSVHFDAIIRPTPMNRDTALMKTDITVVNTTYLGVGHCDTQISIDCLRALYDFDYTPIASGRNSYGIGRSL